MLRIPLIPFSEFQRVRKENIDKYKRLSIIADMCRLNALSIVKIAGSGHIGSSFSAMDLVVWLYHEKINKEFIGTSHPERDIYFSSKGHDVPGFYSVLFSFGVIPKEKFLRLRRLGGLDGHPDIGVPGIESNSGSLGMGISKGRGMAWAKRYLAKSGYVFVMTGDGEWQEGQNFEAMQAAAQQKVNNFIVIIDHNKVQSDKLVSEIVDLGDLEKKLHLFGWEVFRCPGHDFKEIEHSFAKMNKINDKPKILIADTIKGRGVSFMEHPVALKNGKGYYKWHAGAPNDDSFLAASTELIESINRQLAAVKVASVMFEEISLSEMKASHNALGEPLSRGARTQFIPDQNENEPKSSLKESAEYVVEAYGKALMEVAKSRSDLIILDADLAADCRIREFELTYPRQFIECGIAEQDMVSMAGGLARQGLLPVVNSFASFLAARANEQIYNNASEGTKIIYACHYAGLIPAGPGKSHQSIRDISLLKALPNIIIIQPCNPLETHQAVEYATMIARENTALRLAIGPSPRMINLPKDYKLCFGQGVELTEGQDAILFAYGPVMLHEALRASEILHTKGFALKVINMPWLNRVDRKWLKECLNTHQKIYVMEDHAPIGGLADSLLDLMNEMNILERRLLIKFAVEGYPACGTPSEALRHHQLDGDSIARRILE